jgi:nucleoside 2-deoxyribosyltransferase
MKNIYIAYSVTNGNQDVEIIKGLIDWLDENGFDIIHPFDIALFQDYLAEKSIKYINTSDIIIADISTYSHGVGFELGYAYSRKKQIVVICNENVREKISKFIIGLFPNIIYYSTQTELIESVSYRLKEIISKGTLDFYI